MNRRIIAQQRNKLPGIPFQKTETYYKWNNLEAKIRVKKNTMFSFKKGSGLYFSLGLEL